MESMSVWIEHLHHPLVFAGFGLFLLALLLRPLFLNNKKLTGTATERLLSKGMILIFILALLAIIGGITLNWQQHSTVEKQTKAPSIPVQPEAQQPAATQKPAPSSPKEATARNKQEANLSITASGQGQVSIGGNVINAKGNVENKDEK